METRQVLYSVKFSENKETEKLYKGFCNEFDTHDYKKGNPEYSREFVGVYDIDPFKGIPMIARETGEYIKDGDVAKFVIDGLSLESNTELPQIKVPEGFVFDMNNLSLTGLNKVFKAF